MNINQLKTNFKKEAAAGLASALVTNNDPEKEPASRAGDMWQGALASEGGAGLGALLGSLLGAPLAAKGINAIKPGAGSKALVPLTLAALLSGYIGGGMLGHKFSKNLAKKRDEKRAALLNKKAYAVSKGIVNKELLNKELLNKDLLNKIMHKTFKDSAKETIADAIGFAKRNPKTTGAITLSLLLSNLNAVRDNIANKHDTIRF